MADLRRIAMLIGKRRSRAGDERLRRRLAAAGLSPERIEAAFRYARFLELRPGAAPRARRGRAFATAGLAAWTAAVGAASGLRLWLGPGPSSAEAMPEQLRVRDAIASYRPLPLERPRLLDGLLPPAREGDACAEFLRAAREARPVSDRLLTGKLDPDVPGLETLARGAGLARCDLPSELRTAENDDYWARLRLEVAVIGRLLDALVRRGERRLDAGRFDLAQADALAGLSAGRRLLDSWLPDGQAEGLRAIENSIELYRRALAGRGVLDPATRVRLGRVAAESRAYAADPRELAALAALARSPGALDSLSRRLEAPFARPYGLAALEAAALSWSAGEIRAGRPDPRRARWLLIAARCKDGRTSALAWASLRRLFRAAAACRSMPPDRRTQACPALTG
ncbi:MAG: hypothetical protein HY925_10400 [Elusimicrobia bacterium]|nr:hypothetical protein [Elusimicrobiota bacterium]